MVNVRQTVINTLAVDSKTWSRRFQNNLPTMKIFTKTLRLRWPKTPLKVIKTVAIIIIIWAMVDKLYTKFTLPTTLFELRLPNAPQLSLTHFTLTKKLVHCQRFL